MDRRELAGFRHALKDRYEIRNELGHGGAAVVFLADDLTSNRRVAIKVLRPEMWANVSVKRFTREIAVASVLEHTNILPLLASGEASGLPYYVMPVVDGGSLADLMSRVGPLSFDQAIAIARDVAAGLDYAHARGVIHRDIKPHNILFDGERPVIADFGIARAITEAGGETLTSSGIVIGTPRYMSPEQSGSEKTIDGRSDIYSLGCVVYEMLAGEPPFNGVTAKSIIAKQMHERPPRLSVLRPTATLELEQALEKALAKQPADRFTTAGDFVAALSAAAGGVTARRRRIMRYAAIAATAACLLVAGAWAFRRATRPPVEDSVAMAKNIAVLYFDDLTPDKRLGHIAAGLTEDLIDRLSQVQALKVISPNGVRAYRDSAPPLDTIARRLHVGTLISGSVAGSGPLMRLTVRVIDAKTGNQIRSRVIEKPSWDLINLLDSVNTDVEFWLRERIGQRVRMREQRQGTRSADAWDALARGQDLANQALSRIMEGNGKAAIVMLGQSDTALLRAHALDKDWIEPGVLRARNANTRAYADPAGFVTGLRWAIVLSDSALRSDSSNAQARAIRGESEMRLAVLVSTPSSDALLDSAEVDLRRAAELRPDRAGTWAALGEALSHVGRNAEAAAAYKVAFDADAFLADAAGVYQGLIVSTLYAGQEDESRRWCSRAHERFPGDVRFVACELTILGSTGHSARDVDSAWASLRRIDRQGSAGVFAFTWTLRRAMVAAVLARAGMSDSARSVLRRAESERGSRPPVDPAAEAYVRLLLGEKNVALQLLSQAIAARPILRRSVARNPWFRSLANDQRFRTMTAMQ